MSLWLKTEEEPGSDRPAAALLGASPGAGGQGLARYVLDHPDRVCGRRVLDFASGSGLVAIAAAKAGASAVLAADIDPWTETAIRLNAALNEVDIAFTGLDLVGKPVEADVLLAGDVFYDRAFADLLVPWFRELTEKGVSVLVGDPERAYLPKERLRAEATYQVPVTRALEDSEVKKTTVWRFI